MAGRSRSRFAAARWLELRVRITPGTWKSGPCESCDLSGRGLFDGPFPRPEETYRVCVIECDL